MSREQGRIGASTTPQQEICGPHIPYAIACNADSPWMYLMNFYCRYDRALRRNRHFEATASTPHIFMRMVEPTINHIWAGSSLKAGLICDI